MTTLPEDARLAELRALLLAGRYVEAVTRQRAATGESLPQATAALQALIDAAQAEVEGRGLLPPPWLLDAYVEALCHPYTGDGLSAQAGRQAAALPEALRLVALRRAGELHRAAYSLAVDCYAGKLAGAALPERLRRLLPGFSAASYDKVIELGFRDAR